MTRFAMLPVRDYSNLFLGLSLFLGVSLLSGFLAALMGTTQASEVAGALGNVVGGVVGAAGAIFAVFLTLSRQRTEEIAKVTGATTAEVISLVKYVIWSISVCKDIVEGRRNIPRADALYIIRNLVSPPTVYPAIADRVGLLPNPQATVQFYMRVSEARTMTESLVRNSASTAPTNVTPEFAANVADCLITALQLAVPIVGGFPPSSAALDANIRLTTLNQIALCLQMAAAVFPSAQSFQGPTPARNPAGQGQS